MKKRNSQILAQEMLYQAELSAQAILVPEEERESLRTLRYGMALYSYKKQQQITNGQVMKLHGDNLEMYI